MRTEIERKREREKERERKKERAQVISMKRCECDVGQMVDSGDEMCAG